MDLLSLLSGAFEVLEKMFTSYDVDRCGMITFQQLVQRLAVSGFRDEETLQKLFQRVDSGTLVRGEERSTGCHERDDLRPVECLCCVGAGSCKEDHFFRVCEKRGFVVVRETRGSGGGPCRHTFRNATDCETQTSSTGGGKL
jgi:hypothetical protein